MGIDPPFPGYLKLSATRQKISKAIGNESSCKDISDAGGFPVVLGMDMSEIRHKRVGLHPSSLSPRGGQVLDTSLRFGLKRSIEALRETKRNGREPRSQNRPRRSSEKRTPGRLPSLQSLSSRPLALISSSSPRRIVGYGARASHRTRARTRKKESSTPWIVLGAKVCLARRFKPAGDGWHQWHQ